MKCFKITVLVLLYLTENTFLGSYRTDGKDNRGINFVSKKQKYSVH